MASYVAARLLDSDIPNSNTTPRNRGLGLDLNEVGRTIAKRMTFYYVRSFQWGWWVGKRILYLQTIIHQQGDPDSSHVSWGFLLWRSIRSSEMNICDSETDLQWYAKPWSWWMRNGCVQYPRIWYILGAGIMFFMGVETRLYTDVKVWLVSR